MNLPVTSTDTNLTPDIDENSYSWVYHSIYLLFPHSLNHNDTDITCCNKKLNNLVSSNTSLNILFPFFPLEFYLPLKFTLLISIYPPLAPKSDGTSIRNIEENAI